MDQLSNIIASKASQGAQKQAPRASAAHEGDAQKFMKALNAKLASLKDNTKLREKLVAQLDKKPPAVKAEIAQKLQASQPKNDQELLQNLTALLNGDAKPALTTDLSASLALSLQNDAGDQEMLDKLTALFKTGAQDITQFRDGAIDMMQQAGMGPQQIDRMLVKLSGALGAQLSPEQQTALMMPLDGDTAPQSAQADTSKFMPAHAADDTDSPPPAAKDAPAPQQATPAQDAPAAAPKSQSHAGAHLSLINSFASDDQGASGGFGQSFSQGTYNMAGTTAGTAATQTAAGTPGSFVNYMSSASSAQTTQTIALQIQRNAQTQVDTFRMQLHPADLGQLEVRLKFAKDGTMKAHLVAEKPETLALLQKDSGQLQKLLEQSGLQMDGSSLSFDLGQQRDQQAQAYEGRDKSPYAGGEEDEDGALAAAGVQAKISVEAMGSIRQGGVNIMV